jgi:predicted amidophosphoribosyltransferase
VHRADPVHVCPVLDVPKCGQCGALLPRTYCERCGMDITSPHVCPPEEEAHVCPPVATMPRRCSKCGEPLPAPVFCEQCGADLTPAHQCVI